MKLFGNEYHRLNALQYVRAICAMGVVLFHTEGGVNAYWKHENQISWFSWGHLGVPMFFCLSGFVISYSGYLRPKKSADFLFSRIARIYPVYLLVALLFVACILVLPAGSFNSAPSLTIDQVVRTIFFDFGGTGGYVYVGWTLFYEMMFYLCFSLFSFRFAEIAKRDQFYFFVALGLLLCYYFSLHYIAYFLFGVSAFLIAGNPNADNYYKLPVIVLGVVAFAGLFVNPVGALCAIFIMIMLLAEKHKPNLFGSKSVLVLGDSSYSIYLIQVLTVSASLKISKLLMAIIPFQNEQYYVFYLLAICVSCFATIVTGILMRKQIEKPLFFRLMSIKN